MLYQHTLLCPRHGRLLCPRYILMQRPMLFLHRCRGAKNRQELNAVLRRHIMLRRLKADVLGQIPALQRSRVSVLPDPVNLKVLLSARSNKLLNSP